MSTELSPHGLLVLLACLAAAAPVIAEFPSRDTQYDDTLDEKNRVPGEADPPFENGGASAPSTATSSSPPVESRASPRRRRLLRAGGRRQQQPPLRARRVARRDDLPESAPRQELDRLELAPPSRPPLLPRSLRWRRYCGTRAMRASLMRSSPCSRATPCSRWPESATRSVASSRTTRARGRAWRTAERACRDQAGGSRSLKPRLTDTIGSSSAHPSSTPQRTMTSRCRGGTWRRRERSEKKLAQCSGGIAEGRVQPAPAASCPGGLPPGGLPWARPGLRPPSGSAPA